MAGGVAAMDVRLMAALASDGLNVSVFCREHGISRETFYAWRRRYRAEGLAGLEVRSRAPRSSPQQISPDVEAAIVVLRKELCELGVDAGAGTIRWHLERRELPAPSSATIWRILRRRGFVTPEPRKRPVSSWRRFEAGSPNELWQTDTIEWAITTGTVKIFSFLDDHSRVALRVKAVPEATSEATWEAFCEASEVWGVPLGQLSDNGLNFSGKLRGFEVHFERQLRSVGVVAKTSRPFHPQTCGKVERFQQTLKKWLRRRPRATTLAELQTHLDAFVDYYNTRRPHRGIGGTTPLERWTATPPAINLGIALPGPATATDITVARNGVVFVRPYSIAIGSQWRGHTARVHHDDTHAAVFINHRLVRALQLDPTKRYQPSGLPRGRRPT
jgi:transposase InsO family protein